MITAHVDPGICGFPATVRVSRLSQSEVCVTIESGCDMIAACSAAIERLDWHKALNTRTENPLAKIFSAHVRHWDACCPQPWRRQSKSKSVPPYLEMFE